MRYVSFGQYENKYELYKTLSIPVEQHLINHLSVQLNIIFEQLLYAYFIPEPTEDEIENPIFKYDFLKEQQNERIANQKNEIKEINEISDLNESFNEKELTDLNDSDSIEFEFNYDKELSLHESFESKSSKKSMNASFDFTNENNSFEFEVTSFDLHASLATDQPLTFERKTIKRHKSFSTFPWTFKELKEKAMKSKK